MQKKYSLKYLSLLVMLFITTTLTAQTTEENSDLMKRDGKIYVVVAVVLVILTGLFLYVWNLDRKITRLEKNN